MQWISTKDRLPSDERPVLAVYRFRNKNGELGMAFAGTLSYFCYDANPHWQHESTGVVVTHWMKLPEFPVED